VESGETIAIVGESGSGKSVSMLSILRLLPEPSARVESGEVIFKGKDLLTLSPAEMRRINGAEIGMVFQDPLSSLNPVLSVGFQIKEAIKAHRSLSEQAARSETIELLRLVGIPEPENRLNDFPHQFSGGMRQRVMIAMAVSCSPSLLIADEPTTALDVTIQAQILRLIARLKAEIGMSVIWITHDLGVVARVAQRVVVMYAGRIVEDAPVMQFYSRPRHPYSIGLLQSLPRLDTDPSAELGAIGGQPPSLLDDLIGCPFAPRCGFAEARCLAEAPRLETVGDNDRDRVACWRKDDVLASTHPH
jgi:oligopeptide transport system ATP-binding protein